MKFSDLSVGMQFKMPCAFVNVTRRETKAKKPYLQITLFDGVEQLQANYWDWGGVNMPDANAVYEVTGSITEYLSKKQATINAIVGSQVPLTDFMPTGGVDINSLLSAVRMTIDLMENVSLRNFCWAAINRYEDLWKTVPAATTVHHNYCGGTLAHCYSTAIIAKAIASVMDGADADLAFAGGLLHDIGKLKAYKMDGIAISMTDPGLMFEHLTMGAEMLQQLNDDTYEVGDELLALLKHIVLSHHGKLESGSPVQPCFIEAHIVHHADCIDAVSEIIRVNSTGGKWTERLWIFDNKQQLQPDYVSGVLDLASVKAK